MFKMIKKFYEQSDVWIKLMVRGANKKQIKTKEEQEILDAYYEKQRQSQEST